MLVSSPATLVAGKTGLNGAFEAKDGENDSTFSTSSIGGSFSLRFNQAKAGTANTAERIESEDVASSRAFALGPLTSTTASS